MIMILIWSDYRRRNPTSLIILIYTFVSAWCPSQPLILSHPQKPDCPKPTTSYNLPPFASSSHNSRIHDFVPGVVAVSRHGGVFAWESMESGIRIWNGRQSFLIDSVCSERRLVISPQVILLERLLPAPWHCAPPGQPAHHALGCSDKGCPRGAEILGGIGRGEWHRIAVVPFRGDPNYNLLPGLLCMP